MLLSNALNSTNVYEAYIEYIKGFVACFNLNTNNVKLTHDIHMFKISAIDGKSFINCNMPKTDNDNGFYKIKIYRELNGLDESTTLRVKSMSHFFTMIDLRAYLHHAYILSLVKDMVHV